jgi:two-component system, NarL family, invasion response regulator UvrY
VSSQLHTGPRRVLIVDNSEDLAQALGAIVQMDDGLVFAGYALTGAQALEKIGAGGVDVVVLDLGMGDMSGFDVLDRVRQSSPEVKVIMHTGHALPQLQAEAKRRGAAAYVLKDGDFRALLTAMRTV